MNLQSIDGFFYEYFIPYLLLINVVAIVFSTHKYIPEEHKLTLNLLGKILLFCLFAPTFLNICVRVMIDKREKREREAAMQYIPEQKFKLDSNYRDNLNLDYGYIFNISDSETRIKALKDPNSLKGAVHLRYHILRKEKIYALANDTSGHISNQELIRLMKKDYAASDIGSSILEQGQFTGLPRDTAINQPCYFTVYNAQYQQSPNPFSRLKQLNSRVYQRFAPDDFQLSICPRDPDTLSESKPYMNGVLTKSMVPNVTRYDYFVKVLPHDSIEINFDVEIELPVLWHKQNLSWNDLDGARLFVKSPGCAITSIEISTYNHNEYTMQFDFTDDENKADLRVKTIHSNKLKVHAPGTREWFK